MSESLSEFADETRWRNSEPAIGDSQDFGMAELGTWVSQSVCDFVHRCPEFCRAAGVPQTARFGWHGMRGLREMGGPVPVVAWRAAESADRQGEKAFTRRQHSHLKESCFAQTALIMVLGHRLVISRADQTHENRAPPKR